MAAETSDIEAITKYQVNNRTLLNGWLLNIEYRVDAEASRDPSQNFIYITTKLRNESILDDFKRTIQPNEIFQTWFSMEDPEQRKMITVQVPAPTADLDQDIKD